MNQVISEIVVGGLLHDIGKLLSNHGEKGNHGVRGYDYVEEKSELSHQILEQIQFHHRKPLEEAEIENHSLAYVTYIADNIAAMADRRSKDEEGGGFVRGLSLQSIFNILNGNEEERQYPLSNLEYEGAIHPIAKNSDKEIEGFYEKGLQEICSCIQSLAYDRSHVNALLEVLENTTSFVPSATEIKDISDISLYDHSKLTAAVGCCVYQYLEEKERMDFRQELLQQCEEFYDETAFLLYSLDISGIQDFIYTISSKKALKNLRSRSFYLEVMMEHIVDEIFEEIGLSRVNLIYCGGGHAYLLLPNSDTVKQTIEDCVSRINQWFLENFGTKLYIANGYSECTANSLRNEPQGSYSEIFREVSNQLSAKKLSRYSKEEIIRLNMQGHQDHMRECETCKTSTNLLESDKCVLCAGLEWFSNQIQDKRFFAVTKENPGAEGLPLPNGKYLVADTQNSLGKRVETEGFVRAYCKNRFMTAANITSKIWVGDYQNGDTFETLVERSKGIERLGVLRADVDNLGQAFVSGFSSDYVSLSRTSTFSRKLSHFFKRNINQILEEGRYSLERSRKGVIRRNASIIYSGGDDLFIVGAWDDVVGLAIDVREALKKYSQGMLTLSGGIGLYDDKYPISSMAREVGELESAAKDVPNKDAIALFSDEHCYSWKDFTEVVLGEKYESIAKFFNSSSERGKSFLYNLLNYMREYSTGSGEKINLARFAYLLSRLEPDANQEKAQVLYREFAKNMYTWIRDTKECGEAITALYLYVYLNRESGGQDED